MDVVKIKGGIPLSGTVQIEGSKNASLPIFAATLLTDEPCIINNVPDLSDVRYMTEILEHLGAEIEQLGKNSWKIVAKNITSHAPYEIVRKMRASICLLGPLIARLRKAKISLPGGCVIGHRPIDLHLKGLSKLNCDIEISKGYIIADGKNIRGRDLFLGGRHGSTVTGTANLVMAATLTPGVTQIESASCEPEIIDLCNFLKAMGADIEGIGAHHLKITGVDKLHGCQYDVISDRIEAGSMIIAGIITRGNLCIKGANLHHLRAFVDKLEEAGINITCPENGQIIVDGTNINRNPVDIITLPYPGFPTDLQAQMCSLLSLTPGLSIITERIYPNRFMHVPELVRMGADISIEGNSAIINGKEKLSGSPVMASDLRASFALILAGLASEGETWVQRIYHIDRGYEKIDQKLNSLGANIVRMSDKEMPPEVLY